MKYRKLGFWYLIPACLLIGYLGAQKVHETGHWAVLQAFRREPVMGFTGLVQLWDVSPANPNEWTEYTDPLDGGKGWLHLTSLPQSPVEWVGMLAAGQIANLLAVVLGLLIAYNGKYPSREMGLILVLVNSLGQALYHLRNLFRPAGGDEYFIASYLKTSKEWITVPLLLIYIAATILAIRQIEEWRERWKFMGAAFLSSLALGPALMIADKVVRNQINLDNPLFQPVWGFSIPVLIVDAAAFIGLRLWVKRVRRIKETLQAG